MCSDVSPRFKGVLVLVIISMRPGHVGAEGVRWKPFPASRDGPLAMHGPGSYGAVDRTLTLDCLSYIGSIENDGGKHVLIQDD